MRILVTGATGQLGHDVVIEALKRGHEVIGAGSRAFDDIKMFMPQAEGQPGDDYESKLPISGGQSCSSDIALEKSSANAISTAGSALYVQLDISDREKVQETLELLNPDAIIHCAAWTAVDAAENEENKDKVKKVNVDGTKYIAESAKTLNTKLIYISTDYVFNGEGERPWQPDEKDFCPLNYYGQTKLEGEKLVASLLEKFFIVRIAWVFGFNGKNFVKTMINIGKTHDSVYVVNDQIGTPTYTKDLSRLLVDMIDTEKYGYYHVTNEGGYISWYDFCKEIYRQYGLTTEVIPVTTADYALSKAKRPLNSRMDKSKLSAMGFRPLPAWQDAVRRYLEEAQL